MWACAALSLRATGHGRCIACVGSGPWSPRATPQSQQRRAEANLRRARASPATSSSIAQGRAGPAVNQCRRSCASTFDICSVFIKPARCSWRGHSLARWAAQRCCAPGTTRQRERCSRQTPLSARRSSISSCVAGRWSTGPRVSRARQSEALQLQPRRLRPLCGWAPPRVPTEAGRGGNAARWARVLLLMRAEVS
jgi:hypothetical protein